MKSRKQQKTLKRERLQSRVKHGLSLTKKKTLQETRPERDEQFYIVEGICFEYGV
jgi:hypothetical protein